MALEQTTVDEFDSLDVETINRFMEHAEWLIDHGYSCENQIDLAIKLHTLTKAQTHTC